MCIADIAISRRCYQKRTALTQSVITPVAANPDRIALYLGVPYGLSKAGGIALSESDVLLEMFLASYLSASFAGSSQFGSASCGITYQTHPGIVGGSLAVYSANSNSYYVECIMQDDLANELRMYLTEQRYAFKRK